MRKLYLVVTILITLLLLSSCKQKQAENEQTNSPCGDGMCDAAERTSSTCPQDCKRQNSVTITPTIETEETTTQESTDTEEETTSETSTETAEEETSTESTENPSSCIEDSDCLDDYYCKDEECTRTVNLKENVKQQYYNRVDNIESRADGLTNPIEDFLNELEDNEDNMSSDDYDDLHDAATSYEDDVESQIDDIQEETNTMTGEIASITTADTDDFENEINDLQETMSSIRDEVFDEVSQWFADYNEARGIEGPDLLVRQVDFSSNDNETGTFTATIKNVGNEDDDDDYTVEMRLSIDGDTIDSCTEDADAIDSQDETEVSCDFDIVDYYDQLESEDEDSLEIELRIEVDTDEDVEEISEGNNIMDYLTTWTIHTFQ